MYEFWDVSSKSGYLLSKRNQQLTTWMWNHVNDELINLFKSHPEVMRLVDFHILQSQNVHIFRQNCSNVRFELGRQHLEWLRSNYWEPSLEWKKIYSYYFYMLWYFLIWFLYYWYFISYIGKGRRNEPRSGCPSPLICWRLKKFVKPRRQDDERPLSMYVLCAYLNVT